MEELDEDLLKEFNDSNEWADEMMNTSVTDLGDTTKLIAESVIISDKDAPNEDHMLVLKRVFGHKTFRPMQWKIISSIMNDKRDNCAVMATGYGKSLCYQYPAVYLNGVTVVISPLISLMEDQVLSLQMSNIPACLLGSANQKQRETIDEILDGQYNVIYMTPEFCCGEYGTDVMQKISAKLNLVLIAVDESHCVSTWGHDFRHQYRQLGSVKKKFPDIPILAVTATATERVRSDIIKSLNLKNPQVLCSGFDRPNLYFSACLKSNCGVLNDLRKCMVKEQGDYIFSGPTIIYCITKQQTEDVANLIKLKDITCAVYHAGMNIKDRKKAHENFVKDKIQCIVATIAFGMGIDKPDVRNIIHWGCSKDLESYYQEVGRAGRDGQPAKCYTFYNSSDFRTHRFLIDKAPSNTKAKDNRIVMLQNMQKYLDTTNCRRKFILKHFTGTEMENLEPTPNCCDNCTSKMGNQVEYEGINKTGDYDFTNDAEIFLSAVNAMGNKFGLERYVLFVRGSKSTKVPTHLQCHALHGKGKHRSDDWWKAIARMLEKEGFLSQQVRNEGKFTYYILGLSQKGRNILNKLQDKECSTKLLLQPPPEILPLLKQKVKDDWRLNIGDLNNQRIANSIAPPMRSQTAEVSKTNVISSFSRSTKPQASHNATTSQNSSTIMQVEESNDQREERLKLYKLLMNERTNIASERDCMPYMVASNEALMGMATEKPIDVPQFRKCQFDGFTDAKIDMYAQKFVNTIRKALGILDNKGNVSNKQTIKSILSSDPKRLGMFKTNTSALISYSHFEQGFSAKEIADKRGLAISTVNFHLLELMKQGYPIKMIEFGVTEEIRDCIIKVIRGPVINNDMQTITPIKNNCPEDITYENIKVVITYLQLREYLEQMAVPYEEFEDFSFSEVNSATSQPSASTSKEEPQQSLDTLLDIASAELEEEEDPNKTIVENDGGSSTDYAEEPIAKKRKCEEDDDIFNGLDSPPRR